MQIINFKKLAKNDLRRKTLLVAEAGYEAINISKVIGDRLKVTESKNKEVLIIKGQNDIMRLKLDNFKRVFVVGIGKGSALASLELAKKLGKRLTKGIVLDTQKPKSSFLISNFSFLAGTHPLPSKVNVAYTKKIIDLVKKAGKDDLVLFFICGGGSALLCGSKKELKFDRKVFQELTNRGANILELNTVRKHLSKVKGGGLVKLAHPAKVVSLIVSDVLGNDLAEVASGPTIYDKSTKKDAQRILEKYLRKSVFQSALIRALAETPKDRKYFKKVKNILFISNKDAILMMQEKAKKFGLKPKIYSLKLKGEARSIFAKLSKGIKSGEAVLAGGESTVRLKGESLKLKEKRQRLGKGGRNQEAVLSAITQLPLANYQLLKNTVFISFASDGHDNTEAAGAIGDILTIQKAEKSGLKPEEFLKNHNSFHFFKKTNDLIFTKKDSFNVADLLILVRI